MRIANSNWAKKRVSMHCNFSVVGGETTGAYRFLIEFHRLGDILNVFQRVKDSILKNIPFKSCYIDDILMVSKGSHEKHNAIVIKTKQFWTRTIWR